MDVQKKNIYKSVRMKTIALCLVFAGAFQVASAQKQGVQGQLFWVTGNQLPSSDRKHVERQGTAKEIVVYEVATPSDVVLEDGFIKKVYTKFVARTFSKTNGSFKIKLDPGLYSVFVKEPNGLYANIFNSENQISPVKVEPKKYSWITISINYEAAY